jgi:hypothetical protein
MSIVMTQEMPGATRELVEEVAAALNFEENGKPAGLIVHTATEIDGGIRIVDVWESAQAYAEFGENRLGPVFEKVAAARGIDLSQMPGMEPRVEEAFDIVLP